MDLRQLRYFVRVAEELHFGRAAAQLGISQPPLSQQVRALEEELGLTLLERTSRRVKLTEPGRLFLVEARRTLEQAGRTVEAARRIRLGEVGELSIAFTASVAFVPAVTSALFRFRQSHPNVHLRLQEAARETQIADLAERKLDLGFVRGPDAPHLPAGLVATPFVEEDLLVAMRSDHEFARGDAKIQLAALAAEPFIFYDRMLGSGFNENVFALFRSGGFEPNIVLEASGPTTLLGLVAAGFGMTVVARSLSTLHLDNVSYREIDSPAAVSRLWLVHHQIMASAGQSLVQMMTL
ncbi:LysR family transcriptional regulator [Sphingobium sp. H33]|uniref:LysR family transcriptional regulator n=2 Tax=Sphingobium nicotianae TaxID=2782607 RepID=A0A9X1DGI6_9SPHN|nr:LysR family transcriptional regulator [Sphingobium nicotianae]